MVHHGEVGALRRNDRIDRVGLAAGVGQIEMRYETVAAERIAGEQEIHILRMAVEARRHDDAVEHAETVLEPCERLHEVRRRRDAAIGSRPRIGVLAHIVLHLSGGGQGKRAGVEHVGAVGAAIQHDHQEKMRIFVLRPGVRALDERRARQHQGCSACKAEFQQLAS